jgi:hypothetical protein
MARGLRVIDRHRENDNKKPIALRQNRSKALTRVIAGSKNDRSQG